MVEWLTSMREVLSSSPALGKKKLYVNLLSLSYITEFIGNTVFRGTC
jgi:hypothetical protein